MASREKQIADALNSAAKSNIRGLVDDSILANIIGEYFVSSSDDGDELYSDSDTESSDPETELANQHVDAIDADEEKDADIIVDTFPLVLDSCENATTYLTVECTKVDTFSCKCKVKAASADKRGCISQFSPEELLQRRLNLAELSYSEKDLLLLGAVSALKINSGELTVRAKKKQTERKLNRVESYVVDGRLVCRDAFMFLWAINASKLTAIMKHFRENGLTPIVKNWGGRKFNTQSLSTDDIAKGYTFLKNFAETHAMILPGRIPGFSRDDLQLLPSCFTKKSVWDHYKQACGSVFRVMSRSSFLRLWKLYIPTLVVSKPMSDLCWQCQKNSIKLSSSANLSLEEKLAAIESAKEHIDLMQLERSCYNDMVKSSKEVAQTMEITSLKKTPENIVDMTMHYCFDFAQQIHYPSSPMQPGPLYFLTPRKCGIFGVCCPAIPQQINYLIDEGMSSSKGSNMVISLLHHFFENFSLGEKNVELHCDNCSGQNKNKFVLWYFLWRTLTGRHSNISINFMLPGHTKFAADWCFGLLKRTFKRSDVHCLEDLCNVVRSSSDKNINIPQLVGNEQGDVFVDVLDWQTFFADHFVPLIGIKKCTILGFLMSTLEYCFINKL